MTVGGEGARSALPLDANQMFANITGCSLRGARNCSDEPLTSCSRSYADMARTLAPYSPYGGATTEQCVAAFEQRYCAGVAFAALHWDLAAWQREIKRRHEQEPSNTAQSNFHFRWIMGCETMDEAIRKAEKFSLAEVAERITMPFLIVHAQTDRTVPVASAYKLHEAIDE